MLKDLFLPFKVEYLFSSSLIYFFSFLNFIYLFIFGCAGSSLLHRLFSSFSDGSSSLVAAAVTSPVMEHGLQGMWPLVVGNLGSQLWLPGSKAHGLCCSVACGIFHHQGIKLLSPALAGGFFATEQPEKTYSVLQFHLSKFCSFLLINLLHVVVNLCLSTSVFQGANVNAILFLVSGSTC